MAKPNSTMDGRVSAVEATMDALKENLKTLDSKVDAGFTTQNAKIDSVITKLDTFHTDADQRFVQQNQFERRIGDIEARWTEALAEIKKIATNRLWQVAALTGVLMTVLTFLINYFFTHR